MSHLHIPDGVLPLPWILVGFAVTAILLLISVFWVKRQDRTRTVPRIAILSAIMMLAMSLPIPVLHYHVNLTVLVGMMAGPAEGFIAGFIANLVLGLVAHGGITVIGLNTLITGLEIALGWLLWRALRARGGRPFVKTAITTLVVLAVSTTAMLGIVAGTQVNPTLATHDHHTHSHHAHSSDADGHLESMKPFATIVYTAGAVGWVIEAVVTGSVVQFISESRPDLVGMSEPEKSKDDDGETRKRSEEA
ncbi:MAG: energy-coupling factor ABC transporter permease [Firmicutes bacterium]|nr:energy-coupling factor ABC transporter permease [Bacillota bacterium]